MAEDMGMGLSEEGARAQALERAAYERGRADERAAVVAWLGGRRWRRPIPLCTACFFERAFGPARHEDATDEMRSVREAIERGEHDPAREAEAQEGGES